MYQTKYLVHAITARWSSVSKLLEKKMDFRPIFYVNINIKGQ